jgi:hypothetical protein
MPTTTDLTATVNDMPSGARRLVGRAMRSWLIAVGLVFGVLLMHGVTADHGMPMASVSTSTELHGHGAIMSHPSVGAGSEVKALVLIGAHPMAAVHPMAALCLAILASGLLLPLLSGCRLKRRGRNRRLASSALPSLLPRAAAARWLAAPSLTRLCVSRT